MKNTVKEVHNDIQILNLGIAGRTSIQIDDDPNRIIKLNLHDVNILGRVQESLPKITEALEKHKNADVDSKNMQDITMNLIDIDRTIRTQIDYIFDADVCKVILGNASTLSPVNGTMACIVILEKLMDLYKDSLTDEFSKLESQVQTNLSKYIK